MITDRNIKRRGISPVIIGVIVLVFCSCSGGGSRMDLGGEWNVYLADLDTTAVITLPGTTDMAGLGEPNRLLPDLTKPQLLHLTRKHSYVGPAYYEKEIFVPSGFSGKDLTLTLGRVIWKSQVWVNGVELPGMEESLTTPHRYDVTSFIKPGEKNSIRILIDNRKRYDTSMRNLAHSYTDDTQVIWNGILGEFSLVAEDKVRVVDVQVYPDLKSGDVRCVLNFLNNTEKTCDADLILKVGNSSAEKISLDPGLSVIERTLKVESPEGWDEFTPRLYTLEYSLTTSSMKSDGRLGFGFRNIYAEGKRLMLNGEPIFLRGTLECCVFPLTGTPPTDEDGWEKVFSTVREYGLNHLRFHSWCPPEDAFNVADKLGIYLQVELPVWSLTIGQDSCVTAFIKDEAERICREYGNHPSFCLMSLGNELQGNFGVLSDLLSYVKSIDSRHLCTTTSFTFEKGHGRLPENGDDFWVTQWTKDGWVRGQGVFNKESPDFSKDFDSSVAEVEVPIVTHEVGQYAVYPSMEEIDKYTGTLLPLNFMAVRDDLVRKGLIDKAGSYAMASGNLAAILYKEEIERAMKTSGISGFQLLDLHDFPGQGTALVGLLDAFWDSKGIVSGEKFREFCSAVVPLARFEKAVYLNDEMFSADVDLFDYSDKNLDGAELVWSLTSGGREYGKGADVCRQIKRGLNRNVGKIVVDLGVITAPVVAELNVAIKGTDIRNSWRIWVYPSEVEINWGDVRYTRSYQEALALLSNGEKVLFNPDWNTIKGIEGKFVPVFWSPVHFPKQAATMGVLCDPSHPALAGFPTEMHSDWQWWDLNINSTTMVIDSLKGAVPVVEMIDNFVNNRRLALLYEGAVGTGRLMVASFDLERNLPSRPVARQMLCSILDYMNSEEFSPEPMSGFENIQDTFGSETVAKTTATSIY